MTKTFRGAFIFTFLLSLPLIYQRNLDERSKQILEVFADTQSYTSIHYVTKVKYDTTINIKKRNLYETNFQIDVALAALNCKIKVTHTHSQTATQPHIYKLTRTKQNKLKPRWIRTASVGKEIC